MFWPMIPASPQRWKSSVGQGRWRPARGCFGGGSGTAVGAVHWRWPVV